MTERPKFFDDLAGVAGGAISAFSGLKDELSALVRTRVDETIRMLDLVRRDEFDVMSDLAANTRLELKQVIERVAILEALVVPAPPRVVEPPVTAPATPESATPDFVPQNTKPPEAPSI